MKILLDENLDWRLRPDLPGHTVESMPLIGWAGLKNGGLLTEAEKSFNVLVTMDSNIVHSDEFGKTVKRVLAEPGYRAAARRHFPTVWRVTPSGHTAP